MLKFDLPARKMEREERLLAMNDQRLGLTLSQAAKAGGIKDVRFLLSQLGKGEFGGLTGERYGEGYKTYYCDYRNFDWPDGIAHQGPAYGIVNGRTHLEVLDADDRHEHGYVFTPLVLAAEGGHLEVATALVDAGARNISYAFVTAAEAGHLSIVKFLLERGAHINSRIISRTEGAGCTALQYARYAGNVELTQFLLENGAEDFDEDEDEDF